MGWAQSVRFPTPEGLAPLLASPGVRSWVLEERFKPTYPSVSLHPPAPHFTPSAESSLRQWLIEAPSRTGLRLDSGLLAWRSDWLYEVNETTTSTALGQAGVCRLSPLNMLSNCLSSRLSLSALPPGWWQRQRPATFSESPLILLSSHNNPNYFHWSTLPGLAPLFLQEYFGLSELENVSIALSHPQGRPFPSFVEPILQLVAPRLPLRIATSIASTTTCRLALQAHSSRVVISPGQLKWWKNRLQHTLGAVHKPWRRLLLSRRHASQRRCCNEQQVHEILAPHGFELVELEPMSVSQQLQLFAQASIVIGVHGAGFTNLVACQPETLIVELLPDDGPYHHYYLMSAVLGLRHGHVVGNPLATKDKDFVVDSASVLEVLSLLSGNKFE